MSTWLVQSRPLEHGVQSLPDASPGSPSHPMRVLLTLTMVVLMAQYVETMVLPGVPLIQSDFGTTATLASWITSAALIVGAASTPLFGKLGDIHGKKKLFMVAMTCYTTGVAIAGFSPSVYVLIFARGLQGLGFATFPLAMAMLTDVFPKGRLAVAQGVIAGGAGISSALGITIGASIVQNLGWRDAFYTALAISVVALVAAEVLLVESPNRVMSSVDYLGALLLTGGIVSVLLFFTEGSALGWLSDQNVPFLVVGVVLLWAFFLVERGRSVPLIQLGLLRIRNVLVANLTSILSGIINFLLFYALVFYAELPAPSGLGLDVRATGLIMLPAALMMLVVGPVSGRAVPRVGPKPVLLAGSTVVIAGFLAFILNRTTTGSLTIDGVIAMTGVVGLFVPVVNMISTSLPQQDVAVGQGLNSTLKMIGQACGPIFATTIMTSFTDPVIRTIGGKGVVVGSLPSATAFNLIFSIGILLTVLVAIISLGVKNYTKLNPISGNPA